MSNILLGLWAMFLGADRFDLAGGRGPFVLTPFLALTPVVIVSELLRRRVRGEPGAQVSRRSIAYVGTVGLLLAAVLVSVLVSRAFTVSASRAALLVADIGLTFVMASLCATRRHALTILARGAFASMALFAIFDVVEALYWIGRAPESLQLGPVAVSFGALQSVGPIPRLAGPVADANRGGFVLLLYGTLIAAGEPIPWLRRVGLALVALFLGATISRSATLGACALLVTAIVVHRVRVPTGAVVGAGLVIAAVCSLFLIAPRAAESATEVLTSPVLERLSSSEATAHGHLGLISRGLTGATSSVERAAIGIGYGNAYLLLQDVFPGNRYGNFHSLYVSMFAESGIVALLATLILLFVPLGTGGDWRPLIAAAIVFNIFYQTTTEPAFWFALAAAWLALPLYRRRLSVSSARETGD